MGETKETLMHVASMLHLTLPKDAAPTFVTDLVAALRTSPIEPPWNLRLQTRMLMRQPVHRWVVDDEFDIDYHVRHSALPSPGGERELGVLVSRLHSNQLDFHRPPWELHIIEGLEGNRFAAYIKIHHSLVDGYTGMRLLERGLSQDPDDREHPFFFSLTKRPRAPREVDPVGDFASIVRGFASSVGTTPGVAKALVETQLRRGRTSTRAVTSYQAPHSVLNSRVGQSRRFATQQYDLRRLRAIAKARGATLNDVLMAICAGGLRRFLADMQQLPERPLIAFIPVNVRPKESEGGGNAVGATLVSLATDIEDPLARLATITASSRAAKARMRGMSADAVMAYSALLLAPGRPAGGPGDERPAAAGADHAERLHLERARPQGDALLARGPARGDLPGVDPRPLDGAQHHGALVRRRPRHRLRRRPRGAAAPPAPRRAHRRGPGRARGGGRGPHLSRAAPA